MGTGILAVVVAGAPVPHPHGHRIRSDLTLALAGVALFLLVVLSAAQVRAWRAEAGLLRRHLCDPAIAVSWGAPPMAMMSAGAAVLVAAPGALRGMATGVAFALWLAGTAFGTAVAVTVPAIAIRLRTVALADATGAWLMPVVPPMVSAAVGGLLLLHAPPWHALVREVSVACFAFSLVAALLVLPIVVRAYVRAPVKAPTHVLGLWVVLGPLGQSVTAAHHLTVQGDDRMRAVALAYAAPVWLLAVGWLTATAFLTWRHTRAEPGGLTFTWGWWAFVFVLGTVVTATGGLADLAGAPGLTTAGAALEAGLAASWLMVAVSSVADVRAQLTPGSR